MNQTILNSNRRTSSHNVNTLKDLVFDPETGDFVQVERGSANEGDTVTKMTEDGFAYHLIYTIPTPSRSK